MTTNGVTIEAACPHANAPEDQAKAASGNDLTAAGRPVTPPAGLWDGKQIRKSVYGETSAAVADKVKAALAQTERGVIVLAEQGKLSLHDYVKAYHAGREAEVGPGTHVEELGYVRMLEKNTVGGTSLTDPRPAHPERFYHELATTHAVSTVRHLRSLINKTLRQAVRHDILTSHVGLIAELPRMKSEPAAKALAPDELPES